MCTYEVGDVLHYRHYAYATKEVWVLVTSPGRALQIEGYFSKPRERPVFIARSGATLPLSAVRSVVPPEEWPDDICAAMAKVRLS